MARARQAADAVLYVGHPIDRQGVSTGPCAAAHAFVQARRIHQAREHLGHAVGVVAGLGKHLQPGAVGFALGIARKTQLTIDRRRLAERGHPHGEVASAAGQRRQQGAGQAGQHHHAVLVLLRHPPGDMALGNVADFVRQHRRQFRFARRGHDEARVDADIPARHRESVDFRIAHAEHLDVRRGAWSERSQLAPHGGQVLAQFGIVDIGGVPPALGHDGVAQLALQHGRKLGGGRRAH
ncbi:Uncharacterised protein [Bordetella pertussis]|nr:Uncharacterised protein [Bordetella pertussis]CPO46701.1 Uncharacterised protein [Bordetella pertussis]CRE10882.1 Uncharacterised protein [Bordetella pertussis]